MRQGSNLATLEVKALEARLQDDALTMFVRKSGFLLESDV